MNSGDVLDNAVGRRDVDLSDEALDGLMREAGAALTREGSARPDVTGEPVLVVPGIASQVRLPNLIPTEWPSSLTEMIINAVTQDRVAAP
jgi:hypothetical protein